jgi:hypothetical protein
LKLVKRLSGLAIGLSLICISKWLHHNTMAHVQKLEKSKLLQVTIEKSRSHIIKDFYPEFSVEYDIFLEQSSLEDGVITSKILSPSIIISVDRNGKNINTYPSNTSYCTDTKYTTCKIASFYGVADQKHTISIYIKSIAPELYSLNPQIEARVSRMHITKGYSLNHYLKEALIELVGFIISIVSIVILAIEFVIQKYRHKKYP